MFVVVEARESIALTVRVAASLRYSTEPAQAEVASLFFAAAQGMQAIGVPCISDALA